MEIHKNTEKREVGDILDILVDDLEIFIVLGTCPTLIYKVAGNCRCKLQAQKTRFYEVCR